MRGCGFLSKNPFSQKSLAPWPAIVWRAASAALSHPEAIFAPQTVTINRVVAHTFGGTELNFGLAKSGLSKKRLIASVRAMSDSTLRATALLHYSKRRQVQTLHNHPLSATDILLGIVAVKRAAT